MALADMGKAEDRAHQAMDTAEIDEAVGGSAGDDAPGPVEAIYRESKIGEIYEGANEVQKWVIARQIFGRDLTG